MGWGGAWRGVMLNEQTGRSDLCAVALTLKLFCFLQCLGCWHPCSRPGRHSPFLFVHIYPHSSRFSPHLRKKESYYFFLSLILGLPWWVQKSGLCAFTARGPSSIPGQGTKISNTPRHPVPQPKRTLTWIRSYIPQYS